MDKNKEIPAYIKLENEIRERIENSTLKIGDKLESEREISKSYSISRMTVRQAIGDLVNEGILERKKGLGTFVCAPKVTQNDIASFTDIVSKMGLKAETEVVNFSKCSKDNEYSSEFNGKIIYEIERRRIAENEVIGIEKAYIPSDIIGNIKISSLEGSLFKYLEEQGIVIKGSKAKIQAVLINSSYQKLFETDKNIPLLMVESRYLNDDNKLIFIEKSVYNCDRFIMDLNIKSNMR